MKRFAQSEPTANRRQILFKLVDATDNHTPEPGLNLVTLKAAMLVLKNGADAAAAGVVAEFDGGGGFYIYTFTVGECDTLGVLQLFIDTVGAATAIRVLDFEVREVTLIYGDLYPEDAIFVNVAAGSAGAVPGVNGTPANPVNNAADARTLADLFGRRKYKLDGGSGLSITVDHKGWTFEADSLMTPISFLATANIDGSVIRGGQVGDLGEAPLLGVTLEDCIITNTSFSDIVIAKRCIVVGVLTFRAVKFSLLALLDCVFGDAGLGAPGIDANDTGGAVLASGLMGEMLLRNASTVTDYIFFLNGGKVLFEATASGGTARVSGIGTYDNQGAIA
ncbi:hypothetical protein LCGC14_2634690, partial [marine sediment metagenome]